MYKGFNLRIKFTQEDQINYYSIGQKIYSKNKEIAIRRLDNLLLEEEIIDGTKMQANWFPQVEADVFLSHSHNDETTAIVFAGYLSAVFGLSTFIDSGIWGYSNTLLRLLDDKYCKQPDGFYNYHQRNNSTSHVHMMLSTALNMMMDKTECLFFLNTPNSVTTSNQINTTKSPWIYAEINMSKFIEKKIRRKYLRRETISFSKGGALAGPINESIQYKLDLQHLTSINLNDINRWHNAYLTDHTNHPLDVLYSQHIVKINR